MRQSIYPIAFLLVLSLTFGVVHGATSGTHSCEEAHPCLTILDRCREAGFYRGGSSKERGVFKDCLRPILHGEAIEDVTVEPSLVAACQTKVAERRER